MPVRRGGVQVGFEEVQRDGQDDGRVLLRGDLSHGLEEPQLQGCGALEPVRRLPEALGGLVLALCSDDFGPTFALALGLARHRPLHLRRDLDVLDLDHADLYPPRLGLLGYYLLELLVYGFPVGQEVVEILLAEDAPQGSLAYLACGQDVVLDLDDALVRVHHPEVDHRGYAGGDVVAGDEVLGRDIQGDCPQAHLDHLVRYRDQDEEAWALGSPLHPTEPEDDPRSYSLTILTALVRMNKITATTATSTMAANPIPIDCNKPKIAFIRTLLSPQSLVWRTERRLGHSTGTTSTTPPSPKPTTLPLCPAPTTGSPSPGAAPSGANASTARHRSPCTNTHPSDLSPTGLLTVPTSPIIPSLPVTADLPLRARKEPKTPKSTPPMSIETTTREPSKTPEYGTPASRRINPPARSVRMLPAVGRPWLVTFRSMINSA